MTPSSAMMYMPKSVGDSREPCHKKRRLNQQSPLSEAIQRLSGPPCISAWKTILHHLENEYILNDFNVCMEEIQSLYCKLLLHVGYTFSRSSDGHNHPNNDLELLLALCQCWQQVLDVKASNKSLYLSNSEMIESTNLLSQVLEIHYDNVCIAIKCLDVARHIITNTEGPREERLSFSILRLVSNHDDGTILKKAMFILKSAPTNDNMSRTARILYSAACIIQMCEEGITLCPEQILHRQEEGLDSEIVMLGHLFIENRESELLKEIVGTTAEDDIVLFLRGLSLSFKIAVKLGNSTPVVDILYSMAIKYENTAKDAVDCLSSIACRGGHSKLLHNKLIALLTDARPIAQKAVIAGLYESLQFNSSTLFGEEMSSIISSLTKLVWNEGTNGTNGKNGKWLLDAARLLSFIVSQLASQKEWSTNLENSIQGLALLLGKCENNDGVVNVSLECLLKLSSQKGFKRQMAHLHNLPTSIAKVVTDDFVPIKIKSTAVQILSNLAQESSNLPLLARSLKVVEALIAFASTEIDAPARTNARQCALQALLKLSELVLNRRILAKQVGLLACLIRYVRSNEANLLLPKDKLKDRILEIAVLL